MGGRFGPESVAGLRRNNHFARRLYMTPDQYVLSILNKYRVDTKNPTGLAFLLLPHQISPMQIKSELQPYIKDWAGEYLNSVLLSGSIAKGTAIKGTADLDLFISLKANTPASLKEIYYFLNDHFTKAGFETRTQNVSIGINYKGKKIDLVPGKIQKGFLNYHSLYKSKKDSWIQTNIIKHISLVKNSGRINEIKAIKIWRELNELDFSSIYLELSVIEALRGKFRNQLARNIITVFQYLSSQFVEKTITDPSNTNNILSNDLNKKDKQLIANRAKEALNKNWEDVFY